MIALDRPLAGVHVLLVEDADDVCEFLGFVLERSGARVTCARDGAQALQAFGDVHPDVLVADLSMPVMDGFELIRRLRESADAGRLPAAAISGHADRATRLAALDAGYTLVMAKPIIPEALIADVLALARLRRDG